MLKVAMERELAKHREERTVLRNALAEIRAEAADVVKKQMHLNNTWLIQRTTEALTKATVIMERP